MSAEAQAAYEARQKQNNPEEWRARRTRINREWRQRNRDKLSAHNAINKAVRRGTIVRPDKCQACKKKCVPEASHDDYSKPFDVEWLCRQCHAEKDWNKKKEND